MLRRLFLVLALSVTLVSVAIVLFGPLWDPESLEDSQEPWLAVAIVDALVTPFGINRAYDAVPKEARVRFLLVNAGLLAGRAGAVWLAWTRTAETTLGVVTAVAGMCVYAALLVFHYRRLRRLNFAKVS